MKNTEEIYRIIFAKIQRDGRWLAEAYEIGFESVFGTPESIILNTKTNKITITFNDKSKHVVNYSDDVELFIREKQKENEKISINSKG
jgi:hypothetical protein